MLKHIFTYEWKKMIKDKTLIWLGFLILLMTSITLYGGKSWVTFQKNNQEKIRKKEAEQFASYKHSLTNEKSRKRDFYTDYESPGTIAYTTYRYAILKPGELALLSIGQSDIYPYYFGMTGLSKQQMISNEIQNPLNLLIGKLDFAFFIVYLLPLIIIALSFDLLSSEREKGTLKLLQTYDISLYKIVFFKMLFRFVVLTIPLLVMLITGLIIAGADLSSANALQGLGAVILLLLLYALFWFGLSFFINAWGKGSAYNGILLIAIWLLSVFVIPASINVVVTTLNPVPSRVELITTTREATVIANKEGAKLLEQHYQDHPNQIAIENKENQAHVDDFWFKYLAVKDKVEEQIEPLEKLYNDRLLKQQELVTQYRFLSPSLIMSEALSDVAGTNLFNYRAFYKQVDLFFKSWKEYILPKIFRKEKMKPSDFDSISPFESVEKSAGFDFSYYGVNFLVLLIPGLLLIILAKSKMKGSHV